MAVVHIFKKWHWWSQLFVNVQEEQLVCTSVYYKRKSKAFTWNFTCSPESWERKNDKAVILTSVHLSLGRLAYWAWIGVQLLYHGLRSLEALDFKSYCDSSYLCICSTLGQLWWLVSLNKRVFWLNCQEYIWTGISPRINPIRNLILF